MIPIHADLHTHTTCSDGIYTPEALIERAREQGLKALAITDHDTIRGVAGSFEAAAAAGITLIPGVELSIQFHRRELHLLGYFFDPTDEQLKDYLTYFHEQREGRARAIVDRLTGMGIKLDFEQIRDAVPGAAIGRPHIARAMVDAGYVKKAGDAFARFLGDGGPADVPKELPPARTALDVLDAAGGVSVLAHPGQWVSDREIYTLRDQGLGGVEVIHPSHDETLTSFYIRVANKLNLLKSGGSDFHGSRQGEDKHFGTTGLTFEQYERFCGDRGG